MDWLQKILFIAPLTAFFALFFVSMYAHAAGTESGYTLLADIPTIVPKDASVGITLVDYMKGLFVAVIGLAIVLAVVQLVIGGIEYVAAAAPSAKSDARNRIAGAIGGLLLILIAWILLQALNPKLLNVGLNLEKIAVFGGDGGGWDGGTNPPNTVCLMDDLCNEDCKTAPNAEECASQETIYRSMKGFKDCDPDVELAKGTACISKACTATQTTRPKQCASVTACGSDVNLCSPKQPTPDRYPGIAKCKQYFDMVDASPAVNKSLAKAIMVMESGCNPGAQSGAGACGIMQMLPGTAASYSSSCGGPPSPNCSYLKSHPKEAICMGAKYLNNSVASLGLHHAIASYNAGLGPGAMGASANCAPSNPLPPTSSCAGGNVRKWECPFSNNEHTACDAGFAETRVYVPGVRYYMTQF